MIRFILIAVSLFFSASLRAEELTRPIPVGKEGAIISSAPGVTWADGQRGAFDYSDLTSLSWKQFQFPHDVAPSRAPAWYRFQLQNQSNEQRKFIIGSIEANLADFVILHFKRNNGEIQTLFSGSKIPMDERPIKSNSIRFPVTLKAFETVEITLGISSNYNRNLLFQVVTDNDQAIQAQKLTLLFGINFGIAIFAIILNLAAWITVRRQWHLAYATMLSISLLGQIFGIGYANLAIPGDMISIFSDVQLMLISLGITSRLWFTREFLNIKQSSKPLWLAVNLLILFGLAVSILASDSTKSAIVFPFMEILGLLVFVVGFSAVFLAIRKKTSPFGWYFAVAQVVMLFGGVMWDLGFHGDLAPSILGLHMYMIAYIIENGLITYAFFMHVNSMRTQAAQADVNRSEAERMGHFVRVLSHDITNYVTIIKGAGERIPQENASPANLNKLSNRIINAVNRQFDVLNSVQKLIAIDKMKSKISLEPIDLHLAVQELQDLYQSKLDEKNLSLHYRGDVSKPLFILAERQALVSSLFANLIQNAVKFSHNGGTIHIDVEIDPGFVEVSIRDHGVGIPAHLLEKLFNVSEKFSRQGTNGERGTGLGLAICKSYMEMFGGAILVESKTFEESPDDHGTSVILIFKHVPQIDPLLKPEHESSRPQTLNDPRPE